MFVEIPEHRTSICTTTTHVALRLLCSRRTQNKQLQTAAGGRVGLTQAGRWGWEVNSSRVGFGGGER